MKTAIGGTELFTIVIVLLLLFTAYMCISINYTAAYKVTDSIVNQIQKDEGVNTANIRAVLSETKYTNAFDCNKNDNDSGWTGFDMRTGTVLNTHDKANYCIKKYLVSKATTELPEIYYYQVKVFYNVDVPFFSAIEFKVKGDTANIYSAKDNIENGILEVVNK